VAVLALALRPIAVVFVGADEVGLLLEPHHALVPPLTPQMMLLFHRWELDRTPAFEARAGCGYPAACFGLTAGLAWRHRRCSG